MSTTDTVTMDEKIDSRRITINGRDHYQSAEFKFVLTGTADDDTAMDHVKNNAPGDYQGLVRTGYSLDPVHIDTENPDQCIWEVSVSYGFPNPLSAPGDSTTSFDTGGGSQHITQALQHISSSSCVTSVAAPDFGGAIGVTGSAGNKSVEGVDITVPVYTWTEVHYIADADVQSHKAVYYSLTGCTNSAVRGFAGGEVLFLGASGNKKASDGNWEISFKFSASPNLTDYCASWPGGSKPAAAVAKKGWEYLWVQYDDTIDGNAKSAVKKPRAVYVERVYGSGAFSGLGIGT